MLWLLPDDVHALHHFWIQVEPGLPSLRKPFEQHIVEPTERIHDFSSFTALVTEWGDSNRGCSARMGPHRPAVLISPLSSVSRVRKVAVPWGCSWCLIMS